MADKQTPALRATLQDIEKENVVLRKADGKTVKVPLSRLSKADQQFLRHVLDYDLTLSMGLAIKKALDTKGKTTAQSELLRRDELIKVCKQFSGRSMNLYFTVKDVSPSDRRDYYKVTLKTPWYFTDTLPYAAITSHTMRLTKAEAASLGHTHVLRISGTMKLERDSDDEQTTPRGKTARQAYAIFGNEPMPWRNVEEPSPWRKVRLFLDRAKFAFEEMSDDAIPSLRVLRGEPGNGGARSAKNMSYRAEVAEDWVVLTFFNTPYGALTVKMEVKLSEKHSGLLLAKWVDENGKARPVPTEGCHRVELIGELGVITDITWDGKKVPPAKP